MHAEGPFLSALTRRLAECPPDFLGEPRVGGCGDVHVAAVVSDLLRELGGAPLQATEAAAFERGDASRLRLVLVAAWLLHDSWFRSQDGLAEPARRFLDRGLDELAGIVPPTHCVTDPDRREELARRALAALGLRPAGEGEAQAQDRLATLDSLERRRVIAASQEAERRARQVREAMRTKAAEEAAASYGRE